MKKQTVTKTVLGSLTGEGKPDLNGYNTQNKLLAQYQFPFEYWGTDRIMSVWSDRIPYEEREKISPNPHSWIESFVCKSKHGKLLEWVSEIYRSQFEDKLIYGKKVLTGFRIVRYTNVSSGYPVYRFDGYLSDEPKKRKLFTGLCGDNIERPEPSIHGDMIIYGYG